MKNVFLRTRPLDTDLAALLLRLILGGLFIYHGVQKIEGYDKFLPMFGDVIGIGSKLSFNLVIFAEFFCGLLVLLGLFTRLTVIPIMFTMTIAYFVAHQDDPFMRKELPFTFLLICIPVFILGSGKYSFDRLIFKRN
jgi:putative oxidoreductase